MRTIPNAKRRETYFQEIVKKYVSKKYDCATVRELNFGGPKFDVVGFSPDSGEFHIVECKRTQRPSGVGHAFGQILAYKSMIFESGQKFLNAFIKQLARDGITEVPVFANVAQFLEAGKIPIRFYVALREKACDPAFLRLMKKDLADVGIIRINNGDKCRDYLRIRGEEDHELCKAETVQVPISTPPRPALQRLLDHRGSNQNVSDLAATLDSRIRRLAPKSKSVIHGKHAMAYGLKKNFVVLHPKQEFIRVTILGRNGWKKSRIRNKTQLRKTIRSVRKALQKISSS